MRWVRDPYHLGRSGGGQRFRGDSLDSGMPGGQVEEGESIQCAAIREVKEASGVDVVIVKFCGIFQNISDGVCNILWPRRPVGGMIQTSKESRAVGYFPVGEVFHLVTWKNFAKRIRLCLTPEEQPFYVAF